MFNAEKIKTHEKVEDRHEGSVISFGINYINPKNESKYNKSNGINNDWIDYVFTSSASGETKTYRCLVSTKAYAPTAAGETITVIGNNKLSLSTDMGKEYMETNISFVFQAYAIGSQSFTGDNSVTENTSAKDRCNRIVSAIYEAHGNKFLNIN